MKSKEAEMMEIDSDDGQAPKTPPRIQSINKDEKVEDKAGTTTAMAIDCDPTPRIHQDVRTIRVKGKQPQKRKEAQNSFFPRKRKRR